MNIEEKEAKTRGYGDYPVTIINNFMIPMRDGINLAAKFWFPSTSIKDYGFGDTNNLLFYSPNNGSKLDTCPAVLEYIPYRLSDYTAPRDHLRHPWMASHGYVVVRVDMRGSGDSEGLYYDEYLQQEQDDCVDVLKWIGQQAWSNKAAGMYGKSWGGFNGLQVAYCQPPELKAVISVYSTDDRYASDTPHDGGCVTGDALISWASYMFGWGCRAPDPRNVSNWKQVWKERLEKASAPWGPKWLSHELRDAYWQHASICQDYERVKIPILAIGGWKDAYTEAVFRMVENMPNVKGLIGPWPHEWPDMCIPGPNIEYLQVCLQWWDQHLKGVDNGVMNEPKFRLYLQDNSVPIMYGPHRPGRWVSTDSWPAKESIEQKSFHLTNSLNIHDYGCLKSADPGEYWKQVPFSLQCGQTHGEWLDFGSPLVASDQRISDAHSLVFMTNPLPNPLPILGMSKLKATVKVLNHDKGMLAARVVDVAPDGESTLVTHGFLNLTHREGHEPGKVKLLEPGAEYPIDMELHAASYVIPKDHVLRVSLSACYWPGTWPSSKAVDLQILTQTPQYKVRPSLILPLVKDGIKEYTNPLFNTTNPKISIPLPIENVTEGVQSMRTESDVVKKKLTRTIVNDSGRQHFKPLGCVLQHKFTENYEVTGNDPLSAKSTTEHENTFEYPECVDDGKPIQIAVFTKSVMHAEESKFHFDTDIKCLLGGEVFFEKARKDEIPREFV